jgi:hypothetical protein
VLAWHVVLFGQVVVVSQTWWRVIVVAVLFGQVWAQLTSE